MGKGNAAPGKVDINAQARVDLNAGRQTAQPLLDGVLLYRHAPNAQPNQNGKGEIDINGGANVRLDGAIVAPTSWVTMGGNGATDPESCNVFVVHSMEFRGNANLGRSRLRLLRHPDDRAAHAPAGGVAAMASSRSASPRAWRDKRGVAAVEMAMVAPLLLFILIACVDFGPAISQSIDLTNAVRAGAQYAVIAANAQAQIESTVRSALPSNLSAATITTTCYCGALPGADAGLPPVAACDSACPAGSARMMTIRATIPFQPYTSPSGKRSPLRSASTRCRACHDPASIGAVFWIAVARRLWRRRSFSTSCSCCCSAVWRWAATSSCLKSLKYLVGELARAAMVDPDADWSAQKSLIVARAPILRPADFSTLDVTIARAAAPALTTVTVTAVYRYSSTLPVLSGLPNSISSGVTMRFVAP